MIEVIDFSTKEPEPTPEGKTRPILGAKFGGTRVEVAIREVDPHATLRISSGERTRVLYLLDGEDGELESSDGAAPSRRPLARRSGVYLEPGEEAAVEAGEGTLRLLDVSVPKYADRPAATESPTGYFFEETELKALVDEKGIRERTFWVNTETGLSDSRDLQLGRMRYAPDGYSPRHVHNPSETARVSPEHFYLVESGTGTVEYDGGTLSVGPDNLVLIPAGEWHQLIASETGLDYIEFQAPFDFVTTMDHDPLGKNWYIKGSDDGTGKPQLWVQS